jgi:hypothetical protein
MHPYQNIQAFQHWTRAMSMPAPGHVDPVTRAAEITPTAKVATMGSCFAQHISRHLSRSGCTFFVTETAPPTLTSQEAAARNFGVFSARYGNVYTVRQAIQLFQRAFGNFTPLETSWRQGDHLVDPFRPTIEPAGFSTVEELERSREEHFAAVRRIFLESDWLVFTLGLTEAWRDRRDGAVFPVAPGVSGGEFDDSRYEFVNFGVDEVRSDMAEFISLTRSLNPDLQFLLTVSPVPLVATYEKRHVWSSTVTSKSVLRVAADEVEKKFSDVIYFPSYEVITSPAAGGRYYHDDLRQVREEGVSHVMRLFTKHFLSPQEKTYPVHLLPHLSKKSTASSRVNVVCDEETIEHAINQNK